MLLLAEGRSDKVLVINEDRIIVPEDNEEGENMVLEMRMPGLRTLDPDAYVCIMALIPDFMDGYFITRIE